MPILSAAMDTVTESRLAIAMAQAGGIGVIHRNLSPAEQAEQVRQVKKFESGMVVNPVTIGPDATLADARALMRAPRHLRHPGRRERRHRRPEDRPARRHPHQPRRALRLRSVAEGLRADDAREPHHGEGERRARTKPSACCTITASRSCWSSIRAGNCVGLITVKDIEKSQLNPNAAKDAQGRLRVAAATSVGDDGFERAERLIDAGVDLLVIDTAHGHSQRVLDAVTRAKKLSNSVRIMAGNVATADGTQGADRRRRRRGQGRHRPGLDLHDAHRRRRRRAAALGDHVGGRGGAEVRRHGDRRRRHQIFGRPRQGARRRRVGAAMIGSLLAGTDESPGEVYLHQGRSFKAYRGMGSVGAMARGSADRYFQAEVRDTLKLVPEGIEGQVPYKGPVSGVLHQLAGGLRAAMGYVGARDLAELRERATFVRISNAGLRESHTHDVDITRESPNYPGAA